MEKNKTGKYLKYAIGEIVLVVIGILIALSINNWNEDRKKKIFEVSALKELKANMLADINRFQRYMRVYDIVAHSSNVIIDFIDGKIPYNDSLNIHLGKIPAQGVFAPNKVAYENLKLSGIQLISNDSLRAEISHLYEGTYHYVENYLETEYQFDHQKLREYYLKEMEEYSFYKYAKPIDFKRLIGNQEFRNLIMQRKQKLEGETKIQYERTIKKASHVIEMIDKEIEK